MQIARPISTDGDFAAVRALVADDLNAVDTLIRSSLSSDVALVSQVAEYIVGGGGKRLRPVVVLLSARALGCSGDAHHHLAAIIEFIHTATLLHDDVVDGSERRRGKATANQVFGNQASVLVGDFLYSRSFQLMVALGRLPVMDILADATNTIAAGEVMQLMNVHNPETTEARYREVIYRKTARLFEAGAELGAVAADSDLRTRRALAVYGRELGVAFQLVDDLLDYTADAGEIGKNVGDDLAEGKPTLPIIRALATSSALEQEFLRKVIVKGGRGDLDRVLSIVESTDALQYTARRADEAAQAAIDALESIPESDFKQALRTIAEFSVQRSH
ncbi:MAG: polyprenyl synthetase family protein [Pseudomonadota bacterium]